MKVVLSLLFFTVILFSGCSTNNESDKEVSLFRSDKNHSGFYQNPDLNSFSGFKWIFKTNAAIRSTPVVSGNTVFFGSCDHFFYALDKSSGKELWKYETGGAVNSSAAVSGNSVFFSSRDLNLYTLNKSTGKEIWKFSFGGDLPNKWGYDSYLSSPVIENGILYVGSGDGNLYAIESAFGKVKWKYFAGNRIRSSPVIDDENVYVGDISGRMLAVKKESGNLIWEYKIKGFSMNSDNFGYNRNAIISSPALSNGILVFGARDGFVYALDAKTGKEKWTYDHQISWAMPSPAIHNNSVYTGTSDGHFIQSLDLITGKENWRTKTNHLVWSSPILTEKLLYSTDFSGDFNVMTRDSGKVIWKINMSVGSIGSPVISDNVIYTGADDGVLYAIEGNPNQTKKIDAIRAVYWDKLGQYDYFTPTVNENSKTYLTANGYTLLDSKALVKFFNDRISDKKRSVVVFAISKMPSELLGDTTDQALIRKYLNSGGKVALMGPNPLAYQVDKRTMDITGVDYRYVNKVFGIDYGGILTDAMKGFYGSMPTSEGRKRGLFDSWVSASSVKPDQVTTILATDEYGNASAWIKNYGGSHDSGLLQLWIDRGIPQNLALIQNVIEFGLWEE